LKCLTGSLNPKEQALPNRVNGRINSRVLARPTPVKLLPPLTNSILITKAFKEELMTLPLKTRIVLSFPWLMNTQTAANKILTIKVMKSQLSRIMGIRLMFRTTINTLRAIIRINRQTQ